MGITTLSFEEALVIKTNSLRCVSVETVTSPVTLGGRRQSEVARRLWPGRKPVSAS